MCVAAAALVAGVVVAAAAELTDVAEARRQWWLVGVDRRHVWADGLDQPIAAAAVGGLKGAGLGCRRFALVAGGSVEAEPSSDQLDRCSPDSRLNVRRQFRPFDGAVDALGR